MCSAITSPLLLLSLLSVSSANYAYDKHCEWWGDAPFCGNLDCPSGWKEYGRSTDGFKSAFHFGDSCWFGYTKTLCCKPTGKREASSPSFHPIRANRTSA